MDLLFPEVSIEMSPLERQGETRLEEIPIFDQHMAFLESIPITTWLLPLGVFAVGLRYRAEILEQLDLINGVISNILQSVLGKSI